MRRRNSVFAASASGETLLVGLCYNFLRISYVITRLISSFQIIMGEYLSQGCANIVYTSFNNEKRKRLSAVCVRFFINSSCSREKWQSRNDIPGTENEWRDFSRISTP